MLGCAFGITLKFPLAVCRSPTLHDNQSVMSYQDRIVRDPQIGGEIVLRGTRVPLRTVLAGFAEGATIPQTLEAFPALSEDDILAAIAFAAASAQEDLLVTEPSPAALVDIASFVDESAIPPGKRPGGSFTRPRGGVNTLDQPSPTNALSSDVLLQFPEEASIAGAVNTGAIEAPKAGAVRNDLPTRRQSFFVSPAAAIVAAVIAGAWWAGSIPSSRLPGNRTIANAIAIPPDAPSSADAPSQSPDQFVPSSEALPLPLSEQQTASAAAATVTRGETLSVTNPPVKPVQRSVALPEQPRVAERVTSSTSGMSAAAMAELLSESGSQRLAEPIPTSTTDTSNPVTRVAAPEAPLAPETSPTATPPPSRSAVPPLELQASTPIVARTEQLEIQRALAQYRDAYQRLDADAAQAIWPSVDVRALARAFDSLDSQELAFETCVFDIAGGAATAQCRGSATYTPKVGGRSARLESRQWTFRLLKGAEGWKIQSAQTRR